MNDEEEFETTWVGESESPENKIIELKEFTQFGFRFRATGAVLLREAISDWEDFSEGESFADWFPDAAWIMPNKTYRFDSQLSGIEEVTEK